MTDLLFSLFSLACLTAMAALMSTNRRAIDKRLVASGVALQLLFAIIALKTPGGAAAFDAVARFFVTIVSFTNSGTAFIFGPLANIEENGFIFAVQVLPPIVFFSSLMAVLYHVGIMGRLVGLLSALMARAMKISGAESLSVAANVFVGQTEAPLVVRPYIDKMTSSELFTLMVGGMATIAGGLLAAYVGVLGGDDPQKQIYFAKHLLAASFMSAPAAVVVAKLLYPETGRPETLDGATDDLESEYVNVIEAAAGGAAEGVKLAINVGGMLLAFIALIALVNYPLEQLGQWSGLNESLGRPLDLSILFGYLVAPVAWISGTPWTDAVAVGALIGEKVVFNEFIAYMHLAEIADSLQPKSIVIATYALCGFANFGSIAVQIGGIGGIAPSRRSELASLGIRSVIGGALAALMTAAIAGGLI